MRPLVFLGGINYDQKRNQETGTKIMELAGYDSVITINDDSPDPKRDDTVVFEYANGHTQELPSKVAMKQLNDSALQRYSRLHVRRARALIEQIEASGSGPVDAVFQSVDTSTGILAMRDRPDLFNHVVLVDPSSIIKHPRRRTFLKNMVTSGEYRMLAERSSAPHTDTSHDVGKLNIPDRIRRMRRTSRSGNIWATYLSAQSQMLHQIASFDNSPFISVVASRLDHAYSPAKIMTSLIHVDDIAEMIITESRHAISEKSDKLQQIVSVLRSKNSAGPIKKFEKIRFADAVPASYRTKIMQMFEMLSR